MFADHERQVFAYFDGAREVMGDPLAIYRQLVTRLDGDLEGAITAARRKVPEGHPEEQPLPPELPADRVARLAGQGRLIEAVRAGMALVPYDVETGGGATDAHALAALARFLGWTEKNWQRDGPTST